MSKEKLFYNKQLIKDIIEWDVSNWYRAIIHWSKYSPKLKNGNIKYALDIGARNGGISLFLALNGIRVVCSDLRNPQAKAQQLHDKYKILNLIEYKSIDITQIAFPNDNFDLVVFKSVMGDLHEFEIQKKAINEIYRVLKDGGELWFAENLKASKLHQYLRKKFVKWGTKWRYIEESEILSWMYQAGFSKVEQESYGFFSAFGRTEIQRTAFGYVDKIICPLIADKQKYILYGVAVK